MLRKNSPPILMRADASSAIGSGHVMRCLALAEAWQKTGGRVSWLNAESIPALNDRFLRLGIACSSTAVVPGTSSDAEQTVLEARHLGAEWVIVDGYRFSPDYVGSLKAAELRVLFLDDDGRFEFYSSDIVLNYNISATPEMYLKREPFTQLLLGPKYVLLRREFLAESQSHEHPAVARRVLITMGGSDPQNVTEKVLRAVSGLNIDAKVVIGGGNPRSEALRSLIDGLRPNIEFVQNPDNMAPLMRWADSAISAAGSTCWELANMGLPAIVIAISDDQRGVAEALGEHGMAVNLGWHANLSEEPIRAALDSLLNDHSRRIILSERGQKAIDGRGAARVVEFIQSL